MTTHQLANSLLVLPDVPLHVSNRQRDHISTIEVSRDRAVLEMSFVYQETSSVGVTDDTRVIIVIPRAPKPVEVIEEAAQPAETQAEPVTAADFDPFQE